MWHVQCEGGSRVFSSEVPERELPLAVHVIRVAALLSLVAGVIMMAVSAQLGIVIILLSALYIALAEIINYLAIIAGGSHAARPLVDDRSEDPDCVWAQDQSRSRREGTTDRGDE
jgi:hypothetical protein